MENIKVSVVMPIYKTEKFLKEAINSVLHQKCQNIELILVNDGSPDNSSIICEDYARRYHHITFLNQNNIGVSVARNRGLELAKGEYVFFMDSDDTIDPDFLLSSYNIAKQEHFDIVVLGCYFKSRMPSPPALPTCAMLLNKSFLDQYKHIRFPEAIQPCEDGLFSHQLLAVTNCIAINENANYYYRKHEDQNHAVMNKSMGKILLQIPKWFEILDNFYKSEDLYQKRSLHLAKFVEHEPFEFRYLKSSLSENEKVILFNVIQDFMIEYVNPYLTKKDYEQLSKVFRKFLSVKNHQEFDGFYKFSIEKAKAKIKLKLFFLQFIPLPSLRKRHQSRLSMKYANL